MSRTWSRHASIPDWTNQARVVTAPEDIIINRDRSDEDLERGMGMKEKSDGSTAVLGDGEDLGGDVLDEKEVGEKEGEAEEEEGSSDDGTKLGQSQELGVSWSMDLGEREYIPRQGSGEFSQQRDFRQQAPQGDYRRQAPQEDYRKQVPPDGDDVLMEWREGRQRVVETKREPGDDVRYLFSFSPFWILSTFISDSCTGCLSDFSPVSPFLPLSVGGLVFLLHYLSVLPLHILFTLLFAFSFPFFSRLLVLILISFRPVGRSHGPGR